MAGIPIDTILGSLPEDLKPTGTQKFPQLILNEGIKIDTLLQPTIDRIVAELPSDGCLSEEQTKKIILQRDNVVGVLNNIGLKLDNFSNFLTNVNNFTTFILVSLSVLKGAKVGASIAAKIVPIVPGIVPASLSDLNDLIRNLTFDNEGNSRIQPLKTTLNASSTSVSIVSSFIKIAVDNINKIDSYLKTCSPNTKLPPLNNSIQGVLLVQTEAKDTLNQATYKGFVLQIEEVPYNDKINQRKAIALNRFGINIIETPLSFTTNPQTLINELKFIIDRDNLKAD